MYLKTPRAKKKRGGTVIVEGPFLILMRERDKPASMGMTAIVRYVRLHPFMDDNDVVSIHGSVQIRYHSLMLSGQYGNKGAPVPVIRELMLQGVPVPESIYELWRTQQDQFPEGRDEMVKWGLALMQTSGKHKPINTCYRCGKPRDTSLEVYPCTKCSQRIIAISKTIRIQPAGIPSAEEFGYDEQKHEIPA